MKIKHFYEPILGVNCFFVYEYSTKEYEVLKKLKRMGAIDKDETWEGLGFVGSENGKTVEYQKDNVLRYLVFIKGRWYYTLTHEAVHLVNMVFQRKGIKPDFNNDEYYAYYVAHWYSLWEKVLNNK